MWTAGRSRSAIEEGSGSPRTTGCPTPDHRLGQAHPTVSSDILTRIGHGDVTVKPNIERLEGDSVRFVDGTVEQVDRIVWCTGYKITFPFLDDELVPTRDNQVELYRRVVPPDLPGLYFIGLIQPLGAIMPIAELPVGVGRRRARGQGGLPARERMYASIAKDDRKLRKRYVASKRHTIQVDFFEYMRELQRERRRRPRRRLAARARSRRTSRRTPSDAAVARGRRAARPRPGLRRRARDPGGAAARRRRPRADALASGRGEGRGPLGARPARGDRRRRAAASCRTSSSTRSSAARSTR